MSKKKIKYKHGKAADNTTVITSISRQNQFIDPAQSREVYKPKMAGPHTVVPDLGDSMSVVPGYQIQARTVASHSIMRKASESNEDVETLFRQFMQKLIDDKLMYKLSEIKKMDMLDVTSFAVLPEDGYTVPNIPDASKEEREAIERLDWYSIVPCFEHGALKLNKFRYVVFDLREIDPENKCVIMRLYDYMRINGTWQTGVATTVKAMDFREQDKSLDEVTGLPVTHHIIIDHYEDQDFEDLYTLYNQKELGWTADQWKFWEDIIIANSIAVTEKLRNDYHTSQCEQLANLFLKVIARCNAMLEMNKPSRPVKKVPTAPKGTRTVSYEQGSAPERKTRNVGMLRVSSKNVPRKPCLETVITYKVAKWTVRGHVRHYANGKEVYIKPSIRERKALAGTGEATATTIRFRKKKMEAKHEEGMDNETAQTPSQ